jgi:hypothetical protein
MVSLADVLPKPSNRILEKSLVKSIRRRVLHVISLASLWLTDMHTIVCTYTGICKAFNSHVSRSKVPRALS